jgi:hypothetical protein
VVGDSTATLVLDLSNKVESTKDIKAGKCFRLPKPSMKGDKLVLLERFNPCPIKHFHVDSLTSDMLAQFQETSIQLEDFVRLRDVCDVSVNTTISCLILKVVFLSSEKKGKYSRFRIAKVKDVYGDKHFLTLYDSFRDSVSLDQVYKFNGLLVQNYRKEKEKWGRMCTQAATSVKGVAQEVSDFFAHISVGDSMQGGIVLAHERMHYYECCAACQKKIHEIDSQLTHCKHCDSKKSVDKAYDFSVNLILTDRKGQEMVTIFAFRSQLHIPFNHYTEKQIQKVLEKRHMQTCQVEYDREEGLKYENDSKVITALKITFSSDISDGGLTD